VRLYRLPHRDSGTAPPLVPTTMASSMPNKHNPGADPAVFMNGQIGERQV